MSSKQSGLSFLSSSREARRLELEHAGDVAVGDHLVDAGVVERDESIDRGPLGLACPLRMTVEAMSMTVSVLSPRKSNFTRPACSTSSLANWVTMRPRRGRAEARHVLPQRLVADDDAGGVHAGVAVQPLERPARRRATRDRTGLVVVERLQPRLLLERLGDRRALALDRLGHQLGDLVGLGEGIAMARAMSRITPGAP